MKLKLKELVLFAMLGSLMFATKKAMELLPQIHLIAVFTVAITVVYRQKALYPLYIYIFLDGLFFGFNPAWMPYLYIWCVLWGAAMLLPRRIPERWQAPVYIAVCAAHGFLFGLLYAPAQALLFHMDFKQTVAWWAVGFITADLVHGISNLCLGLLICPMIKLLKNADRYAGQG